MLYFRMNGAISPWRCIPSVRLAQVRKNGNDRVCGSRFWIFILCETRLTSVVFFWGIGLLIWSFCLSPAAVAVAPSAEEASLVASDEWPYNVSKCLIVTESHRHALRNAVRNDREAEMLYLEVKDQADRLKNVAPNPVAEIHYEGLLPDNPKRVRSKESIMNLDMVHVLYAAGLVENDRYKGAIERHVEEWANTYQPSGNPINENKFEPLICGYSLIRMDLSENDRRAYDAWFHEMADRLKVYEPMHTNNWKVKQLKIIAMIGIVTEDDSYTEYAAEGLLQYTGEGLYPDGTSNDLRSRDALRYHVGGIRPQVSLAMMLDQFGYRAPGDRTFFEHEAESGASLRLSTDYVLPYAWGEKQREEWVDTQVELDRRRAEAGFELYEPGTHYDQTHALRLFELAQYFDGDYAPLVHELARLKADEDEDSPEYQFLKSIRESDPKYSTWMSLLVQTAQ